MTADVDDEIAPGVPMTFRASLLAELALTGDLWETPAPHILLVGHGFQMARANTKRISAEMVQFEPGRDWAFRALVGKAMRSDIATFVGEHSVAAPVGASLPSPAGAGLAHLLIEPLLNLAHKKRIADRAGRVKMLLPIFRLTGS